MQVQPMPLLIRDFKLGYVYRTNGEAFNMGSEHPIPQQFTDCQLNALPTGLSRAPKNNAHVKVSQRYRCHIENVLQIIQMHQVYSEQKTTARSLDLDLDCTPNISKTNRQYYADYGLGGGYLNSLSRKDFSSMSAPLGLFQTKPA